MLNSLLSPHPSSHPVPGSVHLSIPALCQSPLHPGCCNNKGEKGFGEKEREGGREGERKGWRQGKREVYTIKREADLKEDAGPPTASSPGSFSPPICIGADLLTGTLTGVAFYCTGKQKTLMPHPAPVCSASPRLRQPRTGSWQPGGRG